MRWFWIDRFTEFVRGQKATAVKSVTLAEEHLHDHFPGVAIMPTTLIIEGMAQTGGILAADAIDYKKQVVLAKVSAADFAFDVVPGDTIEYHMRSLGRRKAMWWFHGDAKVNGVVVAEADVGAMLTD